jgi:hypothetical protein
MTMVQQKATFCPDQYEHMAGMDSSMSITNRKICPEIQNSSKSSMFVQECFVDWSEASKYEGSGLPCSSIENI